MRLRPRYQKVLSDLWGNRTRSLLVLASIAVGLFAIGVIANISVLGRSDMQSGYAAINPVNIRVVVSYVPQGLVERIARLPGVAEAQGERTFSTRVQNADGEWILLDVHAFKDPGDLQVNQVRLMAGKWPPAEGEIVFDQYQFPDTGAQVGGWVTLELPSGRTRRLKVVGVIQDQTIGVSGGAGGFFAAPVQGYLDRDTLDELEQELPRMFNVLHLTVEGDDQDPAYLEQVTARVRRELERNNVQIISIHQRSSTDHPNLYLVEAILAVLVVIGLLVVFLSGFLITNTLQAIMNQQLTQIGILKTVGARRTQIAGIYLLLSVLFGVLAFIAAVPPSNLVAYWIVDFLATEANYTFQGGRLSPQVIGIQAVIALTMPVAAALAPVWSGTRISVQEALSGYRQSNPPDQSRLDRLISRLRSVSMILLIALRNTFRRKVRLALTLLTLTLGGAVFIATFNVRLSLEDYVDQIVQYFMADVNLTFSRSYRIEEVERALAELPGISHVEGWTFARTELILEDDVVGESVSLLAPPAGSVLIEPIMLKGRWIEPGDENAIALSELFLERFPDLDVGDTLRLRVNGKETEWVVVGFFQLAGKISGLSAYTHYDYLAGLIHQPGRASVYRLASTHPDLSPADQMALAQQVEDLLDRKGFQVADVDTGRAMMETASEGFNILTAILLFLAILTAMVGSIGLAGVMSLNVMERTREIGILRAVGASDRALLRMVLIEGALIGLFSWVLSGLAAVPITRVMANAVSLALFGGEASFAFTPTGLFIWLAVVIVLSVLASIIPARSATHLTIREVLAYE